MNSLDVSRCAELFEIRRKATAPPWKANVHDDHDGPRDCDDLQVCASLTDIKLWAPVAECPFDVKRGPRLHEDAELREKAESNMHFIASAHDLADQLAAALELLREAHEQCKAVMRVDQYAGGPGSDCGREMATTLYNKLNEAGIP
jgi:hypothetical protein